MKQYSFLLEAEKLWFGNFPITTDIVDRALGNIKGWKCKTTNTSSFRAALANGFNLVGRDGDQLILGMEI